MKVLLQLSLLGLTLLLVSSAQPKEDLSSMKSVEGLDEEMMKDILAKVDEMMQAPEDSQDKLDFAKDLLEAVDSEFPGSSEFRQLLMKNLGMADDKEREPEKMGGLDRFMMKQ